MIISGFKMTRTLAERSYLVNKLFTKCIQKSILIPAEEKVNI